MVIALAVGSIGALIVTDLIAWLLGAGLSHYFWRRRTPPKGLNGND